ncbi:hypothetical protein XENOCAPTIV_000113 [Xenoophorus captivus]|uniref:Palmitoyltransferase n=1 Tax=Xenoophorus captivus TaxID=1517983 RepID=A0ABV0RG43_9TELE
MAVSIDPADYNVRTKSDRGPVPVFDRSKHAHVIENCHCYLCQVDVHIQISDMLLLVMLNNSQLQGDLMERVWGFPHTHNETGVWFVFLPVAPLRSAAAVIPVLAAITIALGLLSSVLLCHLLCFHIYLRTLGYTNPQLDVQEPTAQGNTDFLANGGVRSVSNLVHEEEASPTRSLLMFSCPPPEPTTTSALSLGQRLPFPAFPLRASLHSLAPALGPVQAAAPPAEYHSDSAESLEEIPVALAKLGSSSSAAAGDSTKLSHMRVRGIQQSSPLPRTRKKTPSSRTNKNVAELRFEMASTHPPSVFVSRASGETAEDLGLSWKQTRPRTGLESRPASRTSLGSSAASWTER